MTISLQLFSSPHPKLTNAHNICTKLQPVRVQAVHAHSLWCSSLAATTVSTSNNEIHYKHWVQKASDYSLFHEVSRLHGQTADYLFTFIWHAWGLCHWGDPKSSQKARLSVVLSVVLVLVAVNSHESLMALDMCDSDLWVAILLPRTLSDYSQETYW